MIVKVTVEWNERIKKACEVLEITPENYLEILRTHLEKEAEERIGDLLDAMRRSVRSHNDWMLKNFSEYPSEDK